MKKIKITTLICLTILQFSSFGSIFAEEIASDAIPTVNSDLNKDTVSSSSDSVVLPVVPTPSDTIVVIDNLSTNNINLNQGVDLQTSKDLPNIQDTFNSQEGGGDKTLTTDKNVDVSIVEPVIDSTDITNPVTPPKDDTVTNPETKPEVTPEIPKDDTIVNPETPIDTPVVEEPVLPKVEEFVNNISFSEIRPKAIHRFSLTTKKFKTRKLRENINKDTITKSASIDNTIDPVINNTNGTMSFSGVCNSKYFVILLYKNQNDYTDNANSYIINKAFECVGGNFSYTIDQLPENLPDGTYYLLVGQQGETGSWTPISSLTEVVINKNLQ